MAHTIGSIGQIVKSASTLGADDTDEMKLAEIKRIYDGFINAVNE